MSTQDLVPADFGLSIDAAPTIDLRVTYPVAAPRPALGAVDLDARLRCSILDHPIDPIAPSLASATILRWARSGDAGRTVHCTNVDLVVKSHRIPELRAAAEASSLSVPDGTPLVWVLRHRGYQTGRVAGTELMGSVARLGAPIGIRHMLFGGSPAVAAAAARRLSEDTGDAGAVRWFSPPYSATADWELAEFERIISRWQPHVLWVGLGAPKQELWMARMQERLGIPVMVGVGAAFAFLAGTSKRAPKIVQDSGMEWLFRLATEPRRLWRRYLFGNPEFLYRLAREETNRRRR